MTFFSESICMFNTSVKIPGRFSVGIDRVILKFIQKGKGTTITNNFGEKKNTVK